MLKEIDDETAKQRTGIIKDTNRDLLNPKLWGSGELVSEEELNYYAEYYERYMNFISEYDKIRKQYVRKEISQEEFLQKSYVLTHLYS